VTTVFRCARRECVGDDDVDDDSYVFASARTVRSLAMVSIEPRAATIRRDAVVVGGTGALGVVVASAATRSSVVLSRRGRASKVPMPTVHRDDDAVVVTVVVARADPSLRAETRACVEHPHRAMPHVGPHLAPATRR